MSYNSNSKDDGFGVELTYNHIILRHMDRISKLSVTVMSEQFNELNGWRTDEHHKINALVDAIRLFESYVPDELKDSGYYKQQDILIEKYEQSKQELKDYNLYWNDRLYNLINLLARKGKLYTKRVKIKIGGDTDIFEE